MKKSTYMLTLGQGGGYDADAAILFARAGTPLTTAEKAVVSTAVIGLKSKGLWTKLDALYGFGLLTVRANALLNWKQALYDCTEVDGGNLTFAAGVGFTGNGTSSALDTNFNPSTAVAPQHTQSSGAIGFWSETSGQANTVEMGNATTLLQVRTTGNVCNHRVNSGSSGSVTGISDGSGLFVSTRVGALATDNTAARDNVALTPATNPGVSAAPNNSKIYVCGRGQGVPTFSARTCSLAFISSGLTAQNIADFYAVFV